MTKEALKLALEALEEYVNVVVSVNDPNEWTPKVADAGEPARKAITAIKEALAQPEQERFLVATIGNWGRVEWVDGVFPSLGDKMYSAPRTWVGLTLDEVLDMARTFGAQPWPPNSCAALGKMIEAKLKEKNT